MEVQKEVEIILTRQLASYLATPAFLVDPRGTLLFYNEPAEVLLGQRFEETGELSVEAWGTRFEPTGADGVPLPVESLPLVMALRTRHPAHGEFWITSADGQRRHLLLTAMPLAGQAGRFLGALALLWEGPGK